MYSAGSSHRMCTHDRVRDVDRAEVVGRGANAALHRALVGSLAADERVEPGTAGQHVVAGLAVERVVAPGSGDLVAAGSTAHQVVTAQARDGVVVAAVARDDVGAVGSAQLVGPGMCRRWSGLGRGTSSARAAFRS